jgi:hypothetical protein
MMKKLVVRIPDELAAELEADALRLHTTISEVVRERWPGARPPLNELGSS